MILDGVLAAPGDQNDVVDARGDGLFDAVLNDRLVDERQHFFGLRFGGRQKPRAEPCDGEDGFAHDGWHGGIVAEDSAATRI